MIVYDIIIIGGGINGCSTARELSLRGFKVALIEKNDLGSATSSASSKLAHGGLRYLEQGNLSLVFEACNERDRLLKNAPHLVKPLPFLIPIYKGGTYKRWILKLGLWLYDALSIFKTTHAHRYLDKNEALKIEPSLNKENLLGAFEYWDAQLDDARLCIECAKEARDNGADIYTYTSVEKIISHRKKVTEIEVKDHFSQKTSTLKATLYINTTGPFTDELLKLKQKKAKKTLSLSKGVHIIVNRRPHSHALLLTTKPDKRVFFIIPFHTKTLIGTTDTFYKENPNTVTETEEDIEYLLQNASLYLETPLKKEEILSIFSGLRPLIKSNKKTASKATREHKIIKERNFITLIGGKYTTFRALSETLAKEACIYLKKPFHSLTKNKPFYGSTNKEWLLEQNTDELCLKFQITKDALETLIKTFGDQYLHILTYIKENKLSTKNYKNTTHLEGTFDYCKAFEFVKTEEDFERRRTLITLTQKNVIK